MVEDIDLSTDLLEALRDREPVKRIDTLVELMHFEHFYPGEDLEDFEIAPELLELAEKALGEEAEEYDRTHAS